MRWEYLIVVPERDTLVISLRLQALLTDYGADGWELVAVHDRSTFYFKRARRE